MPPGSGDSRRPPAPHPAPDPGSQRWLRRLELFGPDGGPPLRSCIRARIGVPTGGRALCRLLLGEEPVLFLWARAEHHAELRIPPRGGSARVGSGEEWVAFWSAEGPNPALSLSHMEPSPRQSFFLFFSLIGSEPLQLFRKSKRGFPRQESD